MQEIGAAWSLNQRHHDAARGGSTLSQQLAKLIYAGDDRHHLRKLRELLYAVELDRTLGKARVLHLYLAMAPWGEGRCGAAAAARHYLNKRVDRLTPTEAAWLASLLRHPDQGATNVEHMAWVIAHLRGPCHSCSDRRWWKRCPNGRPGVEAHIRIRAGRSGTRS